MVPYREFESPRTSELSAADGTRLFVRHWPVPTGSVRKGAALLVHGLGEHSGRYGHVANVLNQCGLEVWAHDHRGFGKSGGERAKIPHRDAFIDDTKLVFEKLAADARQKGDTHPPMLLGHSMGGAIAARAVTGGWVAPRLLVLSSPGLTAYMNAAVRAAVRGLELVSPSLVVPHGLPLDKISHNEAVLNDAKNDPLNHATISPRITMFIVEAGEAAIRDAGKLTMPTLVQAAGDDKLVDPQGARDFSAAVPAGLCALKIYDGLWHEIYNERASDRALVLGDLKRWLTGQVAR